MNEIKRPKTPLIFYYLIVLFVIMLVNALVMPRLAERAVQEVDYGTFMSMTEKQEIGKVQIQSNQILFTNKDDSTVYRTGLMDDPGLVERLYASGVGYLGTSALFSDAGAYSLDVLQRKPVIQLVAEQAEYYPHQHIRDVADVYQP
jgi:ATP-dependent Zn protease